MVHVEIFTGGESGEEVLGARWPRGVVQYFDTFHCESTTYHSIERHYRSIDTWLGGECKSYCKEHSWSSAALVKNSIFSTNADDNDQLEEQN